MKRSLLSVLVAVVALGASAGAAPGPGDPHAGAVPIMDFTGDPPGEPFAPIAALLRGDVASFASHVAAPLQIQDLWFDTKSCQAFTGRQEVEAARLPALAHCLADLGLRPRGHRTFFYGPGIMIRGEIGDDGRLTSLVGPVPLAEGTPVVEGTALAEHLDGLSPLLIPDAALQRQIDAKPGGRAIALVNVCFDARGHVSRADATASSGFPAYGTQAVAVARRWRAQPFRLRGEAIPVCARLLFGYPMKRPVWLSLPVPPPPSFLDDLAAPPRPSPPPVARGARIVAPTALEGHRTAGTVQIQPDDATKLDMQAKHLSRLVGSWKLCIDVTGKVSAVVRLRPTGSASYDAKIEDELAKWRYSPYQVDGKAVPVCTAVTFIYRQH